MTFKFNTLTVRGLSLIALLFACALLIWVAYTETQQPQSRTVRVGLYDTPPKIYRNEQASPAGLFIEIIEAIATEEQWRLQYVDCKWNQCLTSLSKGDIDIMPDVAINQLRESRFDFHRIPVTHSWSGIWAEPTLPITELPDLNGLRIAVMHGSVQQNALNTMMQASELSYRPILVDSLAAGFEAVISGIADVTVSNKHYAEMHGLQFGLRETPVVFNPASLYYAVAEGQNTELLQAIDYHLHNWRMDGESVYYTALKHAMVKPQQPVVPVHWRWIISLALVLVVLLVTLSSLLRWQVSRRTRELVRMNYRFDHLLRTSPVVLYQLAETAEGIRPLWVSENIYRLFGYRPGEVFKDHWWQGVIHPDDHELARSGMEQLSNRKHLVHEYRIIDAKGRVRHIRDELQYLPGERAGQLAEIVGSWSDLTETREQQDQLKFLTHYDTLTHLPNKVLLQESLRDALSRARNYSSTLAVLSIDLDRFKTINESLGYAVGDRLLESAAIRLNEVLRAGDILARVGGDEFVVLIQDGVTAQQASEIARKILQRFSVPLYSDEHELALTVSIGISLFPGDGRDADNLLKNAEIARYAAKQQGRNRFQFFASELSVGMRDHLLLENALRGAIERNELLLHYQPQLDLSNPECLIGIEALIRWQHPELGLVPPDKFIPLAEEIGLIGVIGLWVLQTACEQMIEWDRQQFRVPRISVNLAAQQIEAGQLPRQVREVLQNTGLAADRLELELTESTILREPARAISDLVDFRTMGVSLAVDDFGTGYSSLAYLKRLPIDRLKIDRSFVHDIGRDPGDEAICRAIIQLARALGLETVAEGIEREDQAAFLRAEGCQYAQGFLYSRPLPANELFAQWQGRMLDSKVG